MGVRNYLIEGVSGAGKTSVAEELQRRGYHVVHGDRNFAYYGEPLTGEPITERPVHASEVDAVAWDFGRWIWPLDKVAAIIADRAEVTTFVCGGSRNRDRFIALFNAVFVLEIDAETLGGRLARRGDDEFGGKDAERALVLDLLASRADAPQGAISIDATAPVARVVDAILAYCGLPAIAARAPGAD